MPVEMLTWMPLNTNTVGYFLKLRPFAYTRPNMSITQVISFSDGMSHWALGVLTATRLNLCVYVTDRSALLFGHEIFSI